MRKFLFLFFFLLITVFSFSLNVYPLINRIKARPGEEKIIEMQLSTRNSQEIVRVEVKDFIIKSGEYVYNVGQNYPYSLRNYIEVPATSVVLSPGEVKDFPVKVKIPKDFTGAQAFGALAFITSGGKQGNIVFSLNVMSIIIADVENPKRLDMTISNIQFFDLSSDECPEEFKEKYGDFGTVIKIRVKNTGNMVLALNGELRIVSREIEKIVSTIPIYRDDFIVFPDLEEEFTFFSDAVFPPGKLSVQFEGVSQGVRIAKSFEVVAFEKKKLERLAVRMNPDMMFFKIERPVINEKFQIQNLTFEKLKITPKVKEKQGFITILPRRATLAPYAAGNFYLKVDTRKAKLKDGDNVFHLTVKSPNPKVEVFGEPLIILRHGIGKTDHTVSMTESSTETKQATIVVENTGDMLLEFQIVERLPLRTNSLSKVFLVLPGEKKEISFKYSVSDVMARNAVLLRWRIYKEKEWKEEKLPWPESD